MATKMMPAKMMPGGPVADAVFADLEPRIAKLVAAGHTPGLGTLLVGDDEPSARYVAMKQRKAEELGCRTCICRRKRRRPTWSPQCAR
jgi:methylenetetrahydrofolate dehydrogenase (NADP+)/methenyltetrahydrofolate cyclohydrolase